MYAQSLNRTFTVQPMLASSVSGRGRATARPDPVTKTLKGMIANASSKDIERYKQQSRKITHTIVQKGQKIAEREDILTLGDRKFYVEDVENPGNITSGYGCFTIYQVDERRDV